MFCSNGFDTMHVVCTDLLCVVCIGLLPAEFSTVNTRLGRPMFWKPPILDKIIGTFSYVFFKVLKNFHNQENLQNFVSLVRPLSLSPHSPNQCCRSTCTSKFLTT